MRRLSRLELVRAELHQALQADPDWTAHLHKALQLILQSALELELFEYRGRMRYARGASRPGLRNGYESKRLQTDLGPLHFDVPQLREAGEPYRSRIARMARHIYPFLKHLAQVLFERPPSHQEVAAAFLDPQGSPLLTPTSLATLTSSLQEEHALIHAKRQRS
jgi:hypothetical protein